MSMFGRIRYGHRLNSTFNFEDFPNSFIVLVYVLVGDWPDLQYDLTVQPPRCTYSSDDSKNDCGPHTLFVMIYFFAYIVSATYIFLNLFVAVVLENFTFTYSLKNIEDELGLSEDDLEHCMAIWELYDIELTGKIAVSDLSPFFDQLGPPLCKSKPIPAFWLDSILLQLESKASAFG